MESSVVDESATVVTLVVLEDAGVKGPVEPADGPVEPSDATPVDPDSAPPPTSPHAPATKSTRQEQSDETRARRGTA